MDPIDPADEREWEIHRAFEKLNKEIAALREAEKEFENFMREYYCEIWWFEKDGEAGRWTLRHTFPDGHTIRDVVGPTIHAALTAARGE